MTPATLAPYFEAVHSADLMRHRGRVTSLIGLVIEATGLRAEVGELCAISVGRNEPPVDAEVVGFRSGRTLLMPLGDMHGIGPGSAVAASGRPFGVAVGEQLLGRVLDGLGRPLDNFPAPAATERRPPMVPAPRPLGRRRRSAAPRGRRRRVRSAAGGSTGASRSACARSTRWCPAARDSGSASSP